MPNRLQVVGGLASEVGGPFILYGRVQASDRTEVVHLGSDRTPANCKQIQGRFVKSPSGNLSRQLLPRRFLMPNPTLFDLSNRVALVTGGSKSLGLAMARTLAEAEANILISS